MTLSVSVRSKTLSQKETGGNQEGTEGDWEVRRKEVLVGTEGMEDWGDGEGRERGRKQILSTEVQDSPATFAFMSSFFTRSSNFK